MVLCFEVTHQAWLPPPCDTAATLDSCPVWPFHKLGPIPELALYLYTAVAVGGYKARSLGIGASLLRRAAPHGFSVEVSVWGLMAWYARGLHYKAGGLAWLAGVLACQDQGEPDCIDVQSACVPWCLLSCQGPPWHAGACREGKPPAGWHTGSGFLYSRWPAVLVAWCAVPVARSACSVRCAGGG